MVRFWRKAKVQEITQPESVLPNPFMGCSAQFLVKAADELQGIVDGLESQGFGHIAILGQKRSNKNFYLSYDIRETMMVCQRCQRAVVKAVNNNASISSASVEEKALGSVTLQKCGTLSGDIDFAVKELDVALDKYKARHPMAIPPLFMRLASTATLLAGSYTVSNFLFKQQADTTNAVLAGVATVAISTGYPDVVSSVFSRAKRLVCTPQKPTGFHVQAIEKMIKLGQDGLAEATMPKKPANTQSASATIDYSI